MQPLSYVHLAIVGRFTTSKMEKSTKKRSLTSAMISRAKLEKPTSISGPEGAITTNACKEGFMPKNDARLVSATKKNQQRSDIDREVHTDGALH